MRIVVIFIACVTLPPSCSPATLHFFGYDYTIKRVLSESKPLESYVRGRNYPIESHIIHSADGYILTYHRVPRASPEVEAQRDREPHRNPVLLVHGILQSSAFFLAIEDGLAYKLADAGFDVWLANHRGNPYSKAHLHLDPKRHSKYWQFSFDEMGRYDIPAAIDYILKKTGCPSLTYIGFSMGTTMFWAFADWNPDYTNKVNYMIAMAPIARPSGLNMVMKRSTYGVVTTILKALNVLHFFEFRPYRRKEAFFVTIPCKNATQKDQNFLCRWIVKIVCFFSGMTSDLLDYKVTLDSLDFMSAGSSIQSLYHLLQVGASGIFRRYDYGDRLNMKHYGGLTIPPAYDIRKVDIPVYLIQGGKDEFSVTKDTEWLMSQINVFGNAELLFAKEAGEYNHLDFFFANEVNKKLYLPLVAKLNKVELVGYDFRKDFAERVEDITLGEQMLIKAAP